MFFELRVLTFLLLLLPPLIRGQPISPYTEESHRVMLKGRDCLPEPLVEMMNGWFKRMTDMSHYRALNTVTLEQIGVSMASGKDICQAMVAAQRRVLQFHKYTIAQRDAASVPMRKNDGWGETQRKLEALLPYTVEQCQMHTLRLKAAEATKATTSKTSPKQCLMAVVKESRKTMIVGHLNKS